MKRLLAIVCALAFALNTTVLVNGLVLCKDFDGTLHIEWGCAKDSDGHCAEACQPGSGDPEPGHHSEPEPCQDAPVTTQLFAADRGTTQKQGLKALTFAIVAVSCNALVAWGHGGGTAGVQAAGTALASPGLRAHRTVVRVV